MRRILILSCAALALGCSTKREPPSHFGRAHGETKNGVTTDDFALDTVLNKAREVQSISELEDWINKSSGVTRVDLDEDGKVDFIQIQVTPEGDAQRLSFYAWPEDAKKFPEGLPIAEGKIEHQGDQVVVSGGYTNSVGGYSGHSGYHYTSPLSGFATGYLMARMFSPGYHYAPVYGGYGGYRSYYRSRGWASRAPPARSSFRSTRTQTSQRVTKSVGPIKTARPNNRFVPSKKTQAVANKYKASAPKTRSGVSSFKRRSSNRAAPRGSSFGRRNRSSARRSSPKRYKKSTRRSRPSRGRSSRRRR